MNQLWLWIGFNIFVLAMLAIDLGLFHRKAHAVRLREAGLWCAFCVACAMVFNGGLYYYQGRESGHEFLAGYLIELALSVDNIFVFVLIFGYFNVPAKYQHRVLFWGILGALVLRGTMIAMGAYLIQTFHWILYVFGAFLLFTGIKMAVKREQDIHPEANPVLRLVRKVLPVSAQYHEEHFFVREPHGPLARPTLVVTPLFVVLIMIEMTDLMFAVDSIPAVFAVTQKPLIVYTSNVFAILCLRAMYFLVANLVERFRFLQIALATILSFVGVKMLIMDIVKIPIGVSLGVIASVLTIAVIASALFPKQAKEHSPVQDSPLDQKEDAKAPIEDSLV
jgi:tellurite resistance protein TerC